MYNMDDKEISLSICVSAYNHERYIDECMESILSQQTDFIYEIIVGNDCSTDATEEVLKKYENRAQIINRKENLGLCANMYDLFLRARGKYVFDMAGDDYLYDSHVLQKLYDFIENHDEYHSVSAWHCFYSEQEGKMRDLFDEKTPQEYTLYDFLKSGNGLVIYGLVRNTFYAERDINAYLAQGARNNEEIKWYFYILSKGKKYILQENIYVYRYVARADGSNYNSTHSTLDVFKDYYSDVKMMQKKFGDKYNFNPLLLKKCNQYCVKLSDSFYNIRQFLKVMSFEDTMRLLWYKCYLKLHHYQDPPKWDKPDYYERH